MKHWAVGRHLMMFATLLAAGTAQAAIGREQLTDVVAGTGVIVLAQVTSVEGLPNGDWKAVAKVMEVWKGAARDAVTYGPAVSGDQAGCDASGANVGESVVLFLLARGLTWR